MSRLPRRPRQVTILPTRLALEQKTAALPANTAAPSDGFAVFADVFDRLGVPAGRRYASPAVCMFVLRKLLAHSEGPWHARAHDPFAVRALLRALNELRQAGITAGHVVASSASSALTAIVAVLAEYERTLDALGLFDDADREREAVLAVLRGHPGLAPLPNWARRSSARAPVRHLSSWEIFIRLAPLASSRCRLASGHANAARRSLS